MNAMDNENFEIPEYLKALFDTELHKELASEPFFPIHELSLFRWHVEETEALHKRMHAGELAYINKQLSANQEDINDSGVIPVEYFHMRIRYSDVVYLVSLLETALEAACVRLRLVLPPDSILFDLKELKGQKWEVPRKYLERYGQFKHPKKLWQPINKLVLLRNAIVHDNGSTYSLSVGDKKALAKCIGLTLSDYRINVKVEYVQSAVGELETLIRYYEENVTQAIERIK